ncbi:MAG TPA: LD-carboxypeptidase [Candidatus Binatia bacterium]|nr:LD-carboxypeptidase [Candidatus Binatia bacterium]
MTARIKPPALREGDTVGIVAPASNIKLSDLEAGCAALRRAGYQPFYFDSILEQDLYFAGSVDRRVRELEEMFARDEVRAILCARGGYGANYLLPKLDLNKIKFHPKIFVGYSDLTALLTRFGDATGLATFHGPMVTKDWARPGGIDLNSWKSALTQVTPWELNLGADSGVTGLADGNADGVLYGGCLSILVASLGTPYEIQTAGTILFLEDVAAKPYQIDRMLMQLKFAGKFDGVRGLVFGEMLDCLQTANQGYRLQDVVMRILQELNVPVAYGLKSGHVTGANITLPLGVRARLAVHGGSVKFEILEAAVDCA